ncbi:MAG: sigma-54 dependent transcriptional regulator [Puniceicoccales bacterium]|jgi:DNA-binding NtrC family response regulator|nr:sigma-54 dependent transcriptional regulator [Puniceicoccales bacterium]
MQGTLLIVDDEKNTREGLKLTFSSKFDVYAANGPEEAFKLMSVHAFDVIITDLRMGQKSGMCVIDRALELANKPICIMMTAYGNIETAVEAMKRGAYDFLSKPIHLEKLEIIVQRALEDRNLREENRNLHKKLSDRYHPEGILGNSDTFQNVLKKVAVVAPSRANILITGETGTGKELIAHLIHQQSTRSQKPFVPVHCAALPANLLESELFGHEKGAFTGAIKQHIGRFECADRGTLFLDEIGEIDASVQVKLLRFLETKTVERVGGVRPMHLDVRLICATHRTLREEVKLGHFREDLYYRLNVIEVHVPALRERPDDILMLLQHYLALFGEENGVKAPLIPDNVQNILLGYNWPGNVRELRNFAENIIVMYRGSPMDLTQLGEKFFVRRETIDHPLSVKNNEKQLISDALSQCGGNKTKAAQLLGMPRRTLYRKLEKL